MKLLKLSESEGSLGDRFRARRFKFFESCIAHMPRPVTILDVDGKESFWTNRGYGNRAGIQIELLNLTEEPVHCDNMTSVAGDATDLKTYEDNQFDIVFSNSVIEHLFTYKNQMKMATECTRVGKHFFVQTPNKYFLIEPHFRLPLFNFLPRKLAYLVLTRTRLSLGKKWAADEAESILDEIQLMSKRTLLGLFSNASLYTERIFLLSKSFTVHNFELEK